MQELGPSLVRCPRGDGSAIVSTSACREPKWYWIAERFCWFVAWPTSMSDTPFRPRSAKSRSAASRMAARVSDAAHAPSVFVVDRTSRSHTSDTVAGTAPACTVGWLTVRQPVDCLPGSKNVVSCARSGRAAIPGTARKELPSWRSRGSSRSTTTWSSRPTSGPTGCRRSTSTGPRGSSATRARVPLRGRRLLLREGRRRRRVVRLVALRRPRLPVPEAVGGARLRRPRRHARHLRRDPPGLLEAEGAPRRHGRQPRRGVDLLPEHAPPLLRPDVLEREDKELALLCVQAYNDWMIDEWCAGDGKGRLIPLTIDPAVGRRARRRRGAPQRRPRAASRSRFSREPAPARPAVGARQGPLLGSVLRRPARRPARSCACTSARRRRCRPRRPTRRSSSSSTLTFSNAMGSMLDYIFSGTLERFPTLTIAYSEGQVGWMPYVLERADKLWAERGDNSLRHVACRSKPSSYIHDRIYGCIFDDEIGLRTATSSAWTRSASRPTTRTPTDLPALARRSPSDICAAGRPRRRGDLQVPPRQRHPLLRPGALRHHQVVDPWLTGCWSSTTPTVSARSRSTGPRSRTHSRPRCERSSARAD